MATQIHCFSRVARSVGFPRTYAPVAFRRIVERDTRPVENRDQLAGRSFAETAAAVDDLVIHPSRAPLQASYRERNVQLDLALEDRHEGLF